MSTRDYRRETVQVFRPGVCTKRLFCQVLFYGRNSGSPNDLSAYDGNITLTVMLLDENNFHSKLLPNAAILPD